MLSLRVGLFALVAFLGAILLPNAASALPDVTRPVRCEEFLVEGITFHQLFRVDNEVVIQAPTGGEPTGPARIGPCPPGFDMFL